ncbi:MAG: lysophospholipid acyltransferase family protein [Prolixibacteraceae bacterium]|jgi:1-acyl-sn-glycerol-3-phosphate acyltransferase|nr:lysophospholipid acyltransferase family protein [Prolixibacteraceae bacterium]
MIKASHHRIIAPLFYKYLFHIMNKDFEEVEMIGEWENDETKASLIIGNHVSWWDGFWMLHPNKKYLQKKLHVMILEEQLKMNKILSKVGAYSVDPGSRSVVESLNYSVELLNDENNSVVIYPQGKFSSFVAPGFKFKTGIEKILNKCKPVQILFYTAFVDYFSNRKPTVFLYLGEVEFQRYGLEELSTKYRSFYMQSLNQHAKLDV